jgi:hypothetical protein
MNNLLFGLTIMLFTLNAFSQEVIVNDYLAGDNWSGTSLFERSNGDLLTFDNHNLGFDSNLSVQNVVYYDQEGDNHGKGAIQFSDDSYAIPKFSKGILKVAPNRNAEWKTQIDSTVIADVTLSNSGNIAFVGKYNEKLIVGEVDHFGDVVTTRQIKNVHDFRSIRMTRLSDSSYMIVSSNYNIEGTELSFIKLDIDMNGIWEKSYTETMNALAPSISEVVPINNGQLLVGFWTFRSDMLVMKLASNGAIIWSKLIGTSRLDALHDLTVFENGNILMGGMTEYGYNDTSQLLCWSFEHCQNPLMIMTDSNANPIWANIERSPNSRESVTDLLVSDNDTNFYIKIKSVDKVRMLKKSTTNYSFCAGEDVSVSAIPYPISMDSSTVSDTTITTSYQILYSDTFMRGINTSPSCFPTGIASTQAEVSGINIFPNPAHSEINIENISGFSNGVIIGTRGLIVMEFKTEEKERSQLNIETLPAGLYILQLQDKEGGLKSTKFVKE